MPFEQIINQYFIEPIWSRTGYNVVNTGVYAIVALVALYFIYKKFEKNKFEIGRTFWAGALGWVLFGSSLRVITDSVDSGVMQRFVDVGTGFLSQNIYPWILNSGIFDYGLMTVSPGIYIVAATLFLSSVYIERKIKIDYWAMAVGAGLGILNLIVLSGMFLHLDYAFLVFAIATMAAIGAAYFFKLNKLELWCPVFAHALDGAATWIAIDVFGPAQGAAYFEQHVLSRFIGGISPFGFGLFFLFKFGFSILAVKMIADERDTRLRTLALLVIAIIGLAPGLRDILRMAIGT